MRLPKQFSLRTLLVTSIVTAISLAVWIERSRNQHTLVVSVCSAGGSVIYAKPLLPVPRIIVNSIGHDFVCSIDSIHLYPTEQVNADQQIKVLGSVSYLRRLAIWPGVKGEEIQDQNASRNAYSRIGYLPTPTGLHDHPAGLTENGLRFLMEKLPNLEHLSLLSARISRDSEVAVDASAKISSIDWGLHPSFQDRKRKE